MTPRVERKLRIAINHLELIIDQRGTIVSIGWVIQLLKGILSRDAEADLNCPTCSNKGRIVDPEFDSAKVLDVISGSGDCHGIDYTEYVPCPTCSSKGK